MSEDPRVALERLIRERGEDYASLSRMLGRNPAYIQQFIKRGVPRKLDEEDRRALARYFRVPEAAFGGRQEDAEAVASPWMPAGALVAVAQYDIGASAGPGALPGEERATARFAFDERWLREMTGGGTRGLSMIRVAGDSMTPTLADGDDILVDTGDAAGRLREGIYVLRVKDELLVKRVAINPVGGPGGQRISIRSDNPAYPVFPDCAPEEIALVGRVIWAGRRLA